MAHWKPSTVEDIQAWLRGEYRVNPTDREWWEALKERIARGTAK